MAKREYISARLGGGLANSFRFGGGGGGGAQQIQNAPAPAVVPPVTSTAAEVIQAQQDMRRQSLRKRGFGSNTLFAGESGGWRPPSPTTAPSPTSPMAANAQPATKLGGG